MKVLIVVDMQKDFVDGTLGTAEAVKIVESVSQKIEACIKEGYRIIFTKDTHTEEYLNTQEGQNLPVSHCIRGQEGWELTEALAEYDNDKYEIFEKPSFGSVELAARLKQDEKRLESVDLVGLCTDICVISNAMILKAFLPEVPVKVDASCCAGVTPESHKNALEAMKMCQIIIE